LQKLLESVPQRVRCAKIPPSSRLSTPRGIGSGTLTATYQLVPYLISAAVRNNPTELRPIWDLDAKESSLHAAVSKISSGSRGKEFTDPDTATRKLELVSLRRGTDAIFSCWQPGRSGIEGTLRKPGGQVIARATTDTEFTPLRQVAFFGRGSFHAILLAERVGTAGAISLVSRLLRRTFAAKHPDLRMDIHPAITHEVLDKMVKEEPIKSLVFTRPRSNDPTGQGMLIHGQSVDIEVRMRASRRHSWTWESLPKNSEGVVTKESLLGIVAPFLREGENESTAIAALLDERWDASVGVKFKNGAQRQVNVGSGHATTMSFPIIPPDADTGLIRPTDDQFRQACVDTLALFEGQYGIDTSVAVRCQWDAGEWDDPDDPWEVTWE
jgi:hypothetical protein